VTRQFSGDLVDALGDDQRRAFDRLGEKIPQRTIQASREENAFSVLRHERERTVDVEHARRIGGEEARASLGLAHRPESLRLRPDQVDQPGRISRHRVLIARTDAGYK